MAYLQDLQQHTDWLYLFGNNEERRDLGGQAEKMRGEPNAVGGRTKRRPSLKNGNVWTDKALAAKRRIIGEDLAPVLLHLAADGTIVVPATASAWA